jgi:hypothetical protein
MTDPLARMAIIGTARAGGEPLRTTLPVNELLAPGDAEDRERGLLLLAGAQAVYRLAGQAAPLSEAPPPVPAPRETMVPLSDGTAALIASLRDEATKRDLLIEAAHRTAAVRKRLPHGMLPGILDEKDATLRTAFRPLLGERGLWLASLNDGWDWALQPAYAANELPPDVGRIWDEGSFAERRAILVKLRAVARAQAREWLSAVWTKEKAEQRVELLKTFAVGLEPGDEPFLETLLDDRSAAVRAEAAAQLCRIPTSALTARMIARADAMLSFTRTSSGGLAKRLKAAMGVGAAGSIEVTLPTAVDQAWERDGVPEKPPAGSGIGQKAFWLARTLAMVPLDHWRDRFGVAPDEIVVATDGSEWQENLLEGWTKSFVTLGGEGWLSPLWRAWSDLAKTRKQAWSTAQTALGDLFRASLQPDQEQRVLELLRSPIPGAGAILSTALAELARPWRREFTTTMLDIIRDDAAAASADQRNAWSGWLGIVALAVPPELLDAALAPWPDFSDEPAERHWHRAFTQFVETLQTRKKIYEEIVP